MDITRNQYFMAGLVVLALGIQFRMVDTIELTPKFTQFLADQTGHPLAAVGASTQSLAQPGGLPTKGKTIRPPEWIGYSLLSLGAILVLHSLGMPKSG
ncbi:MAG: hypothetical protein ABSG86_25055 [Thermoguttaceae bacterium]|jgi:hypothetical protein